MLEKCGAVHLASDREWIARCNRLALSAGFGEAYPFLGVDDIARRVRKTPIQFILAHYGVQEQVLRDTVQAVRSHRERDVRHLPMIVYTRETHTAALKHFLKMGFDDIVSFPSTLPQLVSRLMLQLNRKLDYFQAGDYFGPDRRRMFEEDGENLERRGGGPYTHFVIQRDPESGIRIVSQQQHSARRSA